MERLGTYHRTVVTVDQRHAGDRLAVLEAEVSALRVEVKRLHANADACPFCRITRELQEAVR